MKIGFFSCLLILSACVDLSNSYTVSSNRNTINQEYVATELADVSIMTNEQMNNWFYQAQRSGSISARTANVCGNVRPFAPYNISNTAAISFYKKAIKTTPNRAACWAKNGPTFVEERMKQITYIHTIIDRVVTPQNKKTFRSASEMRAYTIEDDLRHFEANMKKFPTVNEEINKSILRSKKYQAKERASWAAAFNQASYNFAKSNPLTTPSPGRVANINRTSNYYPNATPAEKLAMDNMDRTMFGDDAYYRALNRDLQKVSAKQSGNNAGGINITLKNVKQPCFYGEKTTGKCHTEASLQAETDADDLALYQANVKAAAAQMAEAEKSANAWLSKREKCNGTCPR